MINGVKEGELLSSPLAPPHGALSTVCSYLNGRSRSIIHQVIPWPWWQQKLTSNKKYHTRRARREQTSSAPRTFTSRCRIANESSNLLRISLAISWHWVQRTHPNQRLQLRGLVLVLPRVRGRGQPCSGVPRLGSGQLSVHAWAGLRDRLRASSATIFASIHIARSMIV